MSGLPIFGLLAVLLSPAFAETETTTFLVEADGNDHVDFWKVSSSGRQAAIKSCTSCRDRTAATGPLPSCWLRRRTAASEGPRFAR